MVILQYDFDQANQSGLGADWPGSDDAEIRDNAALMQTSGGSFTYVTTRNATPIGSVDHYVTMDVNVTERSSGDARSGSIVRSNGNSYVITVFNPGNGRLLLAEIVNGSYNAIDTNIFPTLSSGQKVTITTTVVGNVFTVSVPGQTDASYTLTSSELQTGTDVGIRMQSRYNAICAVDNFYAAPVGGAVWDGSFVDLVTGKARARMPNGDAAALYLPAGTRL